MDLQAIRLSSLEQVWIFPLCSILSQCAAFPHCLSSGYKGSPARWHVRASTSTSISSVLFPDAICFWISAENQSLFVVTISHQSVCLVWIKYLYLLLCSQVCCVLFVQNHCPFVYFYKGEAWYRRGSFSVTMFESCSRYIHEGMCLFAWLFLNPPSEG